ncbi:MAG: hypothetical protein U0Z44_07345 [Kouleothrix sp.]
MRNLAACAPAIVGQRQQRALAGRGDPAAVAPGTLILGVAAEQLRVLGHAGQEVGRQVWAVLGAEQLEVGLGQREGPVDGRIGRGERHAAEGGMLVAGDRLGQQLLARAGQLAEQLPGAGVAALVVGGQQKLPAGGRARPKLEGVRQRGQAAGGLGFEITACRRNRAAAGQAPAALPARIITEHLCALEPELAAAAGQAAKPAAQELQPGCQHQRAGAWRGAGVLYRHQRHQRGVLLGYKIAPAQLEPGELVAPFDMR